MIFVALTHTEAKRLAVIIEATRTGFQLGQEMQKHLATMYPDEPPPPPEHVAEVNADIVLMGDVLRQLTEQVRQ